MKSPQQHPRREPADSSTFNIRHSVQKGYTPTPTLALFRFFKMLSMFIPAFVVKEFAIVKNFSETKKLRQGWCRGYTLIEILIVVAIIGIIMAIVVPSFSKFRQASALNVDTMNVITLINRARLLSISGKADAQYGIHLETNKAVLYKGPTYTDGISTNETYTLTSGIALTGTASEILFAKVTGVASTAATTTLTVTGTTSSTTVLIYLTGISTIQ